MTKLLFCLKLCCFGVCGLLAWFLLGDPAPQFAKVKVDHPSSIENLFDRNGRIINQRRIDLKKLQGEWVGLDQISPDFIDLLVLAEDRSFYSHAGIDVRALLSAAWQGLRDGRLSRGASTISMQTAGRLKMVSGSQPLVRKLQQLRSALTLESEWTKSEILEAYVNLVPFRGELIGISAAAAALFKKAPLGLSREESALLVSLLRGPNAEPELVKQRACRLLQRRDAANNCAILEAVLIPPAAGQQLFQADRAPFVATELRQQRDSFNNLRSTIDGVLQERVIELVHARMQPLATQHATDAAVLVVDNDSGEILAYVGNTGAASKAKHVNGVRARRSAGSTLKPFLYGAAFERGFLTPASLIMDEPTDIVIGTAIYRPENYDKTYRGPVTVREALASSLNIPAVRTLKLVGVENFAGLLSQMSLYKSLDPSREGFALALGSLSVSLYDLTAAYRALMQQGQWSPLALSVRESPAFRQILSQEPSAAVLTILSDRESRALTFGLENPLATRYWSAVKTGTSKDMTDNWTVGLTQRYTVGVWVGNFDGSPMWNVTGISGAAPIWVDVMNLLVSEYGGDRGAPDWISTESTMSHGEVTLVTTPKSKIEYPKQGMVIALDPEIGNEHQKLNVRVRNASGTTLRLNSKIVGSLIDLSKGQHTLELLGKSDQVIDSVSFRVR